ncbi:methyltransferase domain-containing protein [Intrasporangium sp.]|uniref:methyltransferase domain-containing protein n=1 Tax=Intrasporangium sp. TaxID=1925024 RepID=UPI00293ACC69|nr:methyltransferase domain-containing protein [Intrasporangium sp.]MDV3223479.1 methyltransferase domain-containing protein [Intrasporangium sp.]
MADWVSTRRAYDALAVAYHDRFPDLRAEQPLDRAMIGAFAEYVLAGGDRHILDAGCGTGRLVGPLRDSGLDVTGVDLSPGMIAVARSVHPAVEFAVADLRRMPFAADYFAGVVAWYSLINCSPADLAQALAELARILRPDGYLLTGFQSGVGSRLQSDAYSQGHERELHLRTADEMAAAFDAAGLAVVAQAARTMEPDTADGDFDQAFVIGRKAPVPPFGLTDLPDPAVEPAVHGLGFLGVRIEDAGRFEAAVSLYRDTLGLTLIREEPGRLAWFRLGDGTEVHVYGPEDTDHVVFDDRPCVGLVVDDVDATRLRMESAGIEFLWETQRESGRAWAHYRGSDGVVYELIGPDRVGRGAVSDPRTDPPTSAES